MWVAGTNAADQPKRANEMNDDSSLMSVSAIISEIIIATMDDHPPNTDTDIDMDRSPRHHGALP